MARTAALGLRIEPIVKEALERAAKEDRRTVAAYVEMLIVTELEARGYLPKGAAE
ncbi:hypothetical protein [Mesorhizobium sp. B2-3-11]|uniref:hypothetical protein n=1 Tax=Mesorhizobium sp. B2-3-11 TaxID=2589953 RepID=UPI0015E3E64B|nr:hypothetical protein [Mesorhizobium sp. B2-3-11]